MCGRFTLTTPGEVLAEAFGLDEPPELAARYNVAPAQPVLAVRSSTEGPRAAVWLRWGLRAPGADPAERPQVNARAESADRLPSFADSFRARRCLVPADGFYEWRARRPFYVRRRDHAPFALAALWQPHSAAAADATLGTTVILTTEPNPLLREIHDRMPVILDPAGFDRWLDAARFGAAAVKPLLTPCPAEPFEAFTVDAWVNDARHDDARCIEPERRLV